MQIIVHFKRETKIKGDYARKLLTARCINKGLSKVMALDIKGGMKVAISLKLSINSTKEGCKMWV